jgi:ribonuclease E
MSRQRIRTSVLESSTEKCPICGGSGHVRSVSSVALALLRSIEELLIKGATHNLVVRTRSEVALYVLNQKRGHLRGLEERFRVTITISADPSVVGAQAFVIDRGEQVHTAEQAREIAASQPAIAPLAAEEEDTFVEAEEDIGEAEDGAVESETDGAEPAFAEAERDGEHRRRRRRRRGGRGRNGEGRDRQPMSAHETEADQPAEHAEPGEDEAAGEAGSELQHAEGDGGRRRRRRGRRGGRRHRRNGDNGFAHRPDEGVTPSDAAADSEPAPEYEAPRPHYTEPEPIADRPAEPLIPVAAQPASASEPSGETPAPDHPPARRGSTVREPASGAHSSSPAVTTTPVVSSTAEEPAAPKRGWWRRRLLGGEG